MYAVEGIKETVLHTPSIESNIYEYMTYVASKNDWIVFRVRFDNSLIVSLLLWGEGPQGHRIKPLITQHKQNKRHTNKSKET